MVIRVCGAIFSRKLRGYQLKQAVRCYADCEDPQTRNGVAGLPVQFYLCAAWVVCIKESREAGRDLNTEFF